MQSKVIDIYFKHQNVPKNAGKSFFIWTYCGSNSFNIDNYIDENESIIKNLALKHFDPFIKEILISSNPKYFGSLLLQSTLFEKCNFHTSKHWNELIKIYALKHISNNNNIRLNLIGFPVKLHQRITHILFKNPSSAKHFYLLKPLLLFPYLLLINFIHITRIYVYSLLLRFWSSSKSLGSLNILFISHITIADIDKASFIDSFWVKLKEKVSQKYTTVYFLDDSISISTYFKARRLLRLNSLSGNPLICFNHFYTLKIYFKSIIAYLYLYFFVTKLYLLFRSIFPFERDFSKDFHNSFFSTELSSSILNYFLIKSVKSNIPLPNSIIYPMEGRGWEYSINSLFYDSNTLGYVHRPVKYWDLRLYKSDLEVSFLYWMNAMPNKILTIGEISYSLLKYSNWPNNLIFQVEAIRYSDLCMDLKKIKPSLLDVKNILVAGDYDPYTTQLTVDTLNLAVSQLDTVFSVVFKPHPHNNNIPTWSNCSFVVSYDNIGSLLPNFGIVFCNSFTSASVDAYLFNKYVICFLENSGLNMSPLKYNDNVFFCRDSIDVKNALLEICNKSEIEICAANNILYYDPSLSRLLNEL